MSLICRCRVSFSFENVSEMTPALGAYDLRPCHAKGAVGMSGDSTRDAVVVGRPAAARFEFMIGTVEGSLACDTFL